VSEVVARAVAAIAELDGAEWDACAGAANPFVSYAFLSALEDAGCAATKTGWQPYHVAIDGADGRLDACAPLYAKSHSQGEYVFDHGWADAYERAGGRYYPKLLSAVPFSPVTGPRLLVRPGPEAEGRRDALIAALIAAAQQLKVSSLHVNFPTEEEWRALGARGLLLRTGEQFHWFNRGYGSFDDFLADLSSRKRKMIRKEREAARAGGVEIRILSGSEIRDEHWDAFFRFYMDTGGRKWGRPYLNRRFFSLLGERMAERIALVMCRRDGRWIAGALNLSGADTLYGRYWGCVEDVPFLHFEACYYQAIEHAIAHGLAKVEAGAQGPHKLARGYLPCPIYSAHWIRDPGFRAAIENYLKHERREVEHELEQLAEFAPFRRNGAQAPR
jgi:predicted N-acyltransferase